MHTSQPADQSPEQPAAATTSAQRQMPQSILEETLAGGAYDLFEGYQGVTLSELATNAALDTDPGKAEGMVAKATGTVTYEAALPPC